MSFGTYWRMTINNYTPTDVALVRQGYPDDIRKLVYTFEEGENETPHIQAYIQMKRSVRMAHMKKLFPRANFATMDSAEWRLNQHNYAQKLDGTARSAAVIMNSDPLNTLEGVVKKVITKMMTDYLEVEDLEVARRYAERDLVLEDYTLAKIYVSATYKAMWREYGHEMYQCIFHKREAEEEARVEIPTHTHTHAHARKFSREGGITEDDATDGEESVDEAESGASLCEGDEESDGSESEGYDEGGSSCSRASDDSAEP